MIHYSLVEGTTVWTTQGIVPVEALTKPHQVFSTYGRPSKVWSVKNPKPEPLYVVMLDSGLRMVMGQSQEFYGRTAATPMFRRLPLKLLENGNEIIMVPRVNRKLFLSKGPDEIARIDKMAAKLDEHPDKLPAGARSPLFFEVDSIEEMGEFCGWAGFYGLTVRIRPSAHAVEIDEGRPTCFPKQLFTSGDVEKKVNSLIDKRVLTPALPYDEFLQLAQTTGNLFEGQSVADLRTLMAALTMGETGETWTLMSDDPRTTVELAHIRT